MGVSTDNVKTKNDAFTSPLVNEPVAQLKVPMDSSKKFATTTNAIDRVAYALTSLHIDRINQRDVKQGNVLDNPSNDAYLIEFGGDYTQGWMKKACVNTKEFVLTRGSFAG